MKAKIYFDKDKYQFYYGDVQITTDSLTINEIAVDSELSETSENAVQNKIVKKALDSVNDGLADTITRLNNLISISSDDYYSVISPSDLSDWTWITHSEAYEGSVVYGDSADFTLPTNTLVGILLPSHSRVSVHHKTSNGYHSDYTLGDIESIFDQFLLFNTGEWETYRLEVDLSINSTTYKNAVENKTTLYAYGMSKELKDIRVDYFGLQWATAGDSVRSILNVVKNGKLDFDDMLTWISQPTSIANFLLDSNEISLPKNQEITIVLPKLTQIQISYLNDVITTETLGSLTAEETQTLSFNTDDTANYQFALLSNVETQEELLNNVSIYIVFDAKFFDTTVEKITTALNSALNSISESTDTNINNLNNVTNTNIGNLNTVTYSNINALNNTKANLETALVATKDNGVAQLESKKNASINDITNSANNQITALTNTSNNLMDAMNTAGNQHIQNIDAEAETKIAEIESIGLFELIQDVTLTADATALGNLVELSDYNEILFVIDGTTNATSGNIGLITYMGADSIAVSVGNTTVNTVFKVKKLTDTDVLVEVKSYNYQKTKVINISKRTVNVITQAINFQAGTKLKVYAR